VHCEDLEIIEDQVGAAKLTPKVLRRYGPTQSFGQIKSLSERLKPQATPVFAQGHNVFNAEYVKSGSTERRSLDVFESTDGGNSYMLVASTGETLFGDNLAISRHFMLAQLDYEAQGFRYNGGGSGGSKHPLLLRTKP